MEIDRKKVNIALAKRGLSITQLAEVYGVSRARFNTIINQKELTPVSVGRLAEALEVDVEQIVKTENSAKTTVKRFSDTDIESLVRLISDEVTMCVLNILNSI